MNKIYTNASARNALRTAPADNDAQLRTKNSTELSTTRSTCAPRVSKLRNQLCHQSHINSSATYSLLSHFPFPFRSYSRSPFLLFSLYSNTVTLCCPFSLITHNSHKNTQTPNQLLLTSQQVCALPSDSRR